MHLDKCFKTFKTRHVQHGHVLGFRSSELFKHLPVSAPAIISKAIIFATVFCGTLIFGRLCEAAI